MCLPNPLLWHSHETSIQESHPAKPIFVFLFIQLNYGSQCSRKNYGYNLSWGFSNCTELYITAKLLSTVGSCYVKKMYVAWLNYSPKFTNSNCRLSLVFAKTVVNKRLQEPKLCLSGNLQDSKTQHSRDICIYNCCLSKTSAVLLKYQAALRYFRFGEEFNEYIK